MKYSSKASICILIFSLNERTFSPNLGALLLALLFNLGSVQNFQELRSLCSHSETKGMKWRAAVFHCTPLCKPWPKCCRLAAVVQRGGPVSGGSKWRLLLRLDNNSSSGWWRWLVAVQRPVQWQPDVMHSTAVSAPPATTHHHTPHNINTQTQPHILYIKHW